MLLLIKFEISNKFDLLGNTTLRSVLEVFFRGFYSHNLEQVDKIPATLSNFYFDRISQVTRACCGNWGTPQHLYHPIKNYKSTLHIHNFIRFPFLLNSFREGFWVSGFSFRISRSASACFNAEKATCSGVRVSTSFLIMIACITMMAMASLLVKLSFMVFPFWT